MDVEGVLISQMGPEPAGSGPPLQGRPGPVSEAGATVPGETPEAEATLAVLTQRRFETGPGEQAQCGLGSDDGVARRAAGEAACVRHDPRLQPPRQSRPG